MSRGEQAMVPRAEPVSYYGRPVLKEPVWKWPVPAYLFTGGLAAGAAAVGFGAAVGGNQQLGRVGRLTAAAGLATSAVFLVEDLGKPSRFANMLRVAKPSSPMSVGSWILAAAGPAAGVAAACDLLGVLPRVGLVAQGSSAALAPLVSTYTGVLLADTAIPAWHEARGLLPALFASGALASGGGMVAVLAGRAPAGPARRMALVGAAGELVTAELMHRRLGRLGRRYTEGKAGRLSRASRALTAAGAGLLAVSRHRRAAAVAGGGLVVIGAAVERFAVFEAGKASALDPQDTVEPQRQRRPAVAAS